MDLTTLEFAEKDVVLHQVVYNENTLGYLFLMDKGLMLGVHAAIIGKKGLGLNWFYGPYALNFSDKGCRLATKADFDRFRVCHKGHLKE